mmetsp:Transcript_22924/g.39279  ORF Transcript_22924/g.39279 Transcript_22924/m.39279 type:complete len:112 (+) Transcript_22924:462-797(+)
MAWACLAGHPSAIGWRWGQYQPYCLVLSRSLFVGTRLQVTVLTNERMAILLWFKVHACSFLLEASAIPVWPACALSANPAHLMFSPQPIVDDVVDGHKTGAVASASAVGPT